VEKNDNSIRKIITTLKNKKYNNEKYNYTREQLEHF
jgi:hypothetical protein